jgi:hypothetical protein
VCDLWIDVKLTESAFVSPRHKRRFALLAPSNLDTKQATGSEPKLANVYYFHTDQVGLPEELSDSQGNIRWRASYKTWGSTVSESWETVSLNGELINPLIANDPSARTSSRTIKPRSNKTCASKASTSIAIPGFTTTPSASTILISDGLSRPIRLD